ncbi:hypothetical protein BEL04_17130 [Mucilaginibacter sp. PPCGB 2223]|uniref:energy transducer TonB n=1 Tax=Mucilaginibacter sp. PPCGB 2223 TaxID=1886027 RepID=UPI0008241B52|nr:energy transducer TonB [Mucilaginibacter sp. PPCGB 2223]OCX51737.1 hypothetical protein BEL04_17130 [Mucilaginibacter sp. PPCGB 2223]
MEPLQNIKLSFKCPKQLNELRPCDGDWYCDGCQKIVHDFRGMSETQIIDVINTNAHPTCGILEAGRIQVSPRQNKWRYWVSAAVVFLGLTACKQIELEKPWQGDTIKAAQPKDTAQDVFVGAIEINPEFPGGEKAWKDFLAKNIKWGGNEDVQGRVYAQFMVQADGSITDVKIVRGLTRKIDSMVVGVLKHSPKWKPGIQNGKPYRVQYTLPIKFSLE